MFDDSNEHDAGSERFAGLAVGLAIGAILGAGVALLMAPKAGVDTRRQLRASARRFGSNAGHAMTDLSNTVAETARTAGHRTEGVVADVKDRVKEVTRGVKDAVKANNRG